MGTADLPLRRLVGKVAVITGAAAGIGEAAARLFVAHGAKVVVADVKDEIGEKLCSDLGADCTKYVHCDVRRESHVAAAVKLAVQSFGKLDVYYSNAGILGTVNPIEALDIDELEKVMAVNLRGTVLGIKHAAQAMIPAKQGVIISTSSFAGSLAGLGPSAYSISKAAVIAATHSASAELSKYGIRVNCISPAGTATPMSLEIVRLYRPDMAMQELEERVNRLNTSILAGSNLTPDSIAKAALFLASNDSEFVSSHNLVLDGGYSMNKVYFDETYFE